MKYSTKYSGIKMKKNTHKTKKHKSHIRRRTSKKQRSHTRRRTSKKQRSHTRRRNSKKYKGGELAVKPFESFGYPHGASSDSQAAMRVGQVKDSEQYLMNKIGGRGGGEPEDTEVQANVAKTMEVPQFAPIGGIKTVYNTTNLSAAGNLTTLIGTVDAENDHFAGAQSGAQAEALSGLLTGGRRKKTRKSRY
jgi:hypothetical protein